MFLGSLRCGKISPDSSDIIDLNVEGLYYSGSIDSSNETFGFSLQFTIEENTYFWGGSRSAGYTIRPGTD